MAVYTPDSTRVVHYTYADMSARQIVRPIHLVQYDEGIPIIAVKLYNDGLEYTIPDNAEINIRYGKTDGKFVYNPALGWDTAKHTVFFDVTKQMTAVAGDANPVIEIIVNDKVVSSGAIAVQVDYNPIQVQSIMSSNEYITAKQYAEQAVDAAARASNSANQASGYADTASNKANSASSSATNAASSASSANTSMTNARQYAEQAAASKNAAALSQQAAKTSETNAQSSANAAATSAGLAQAAYEEILGADIGKFGSQLAIHHSVLQPLYDSNGDTILDSAGNEIQTATIFTTEADIISAQNDLVELKNFKKNTELSLYKADKKASTAYDELLGNNSMSFANYLATKHSILRPIYDSNGNELLDSKGDRILSETTLVDMNYLSVLEKKVSDLEFFINDVLSQLRYTQTHAILDNKF